MVIFKRVALLVLMTGVCTISYAEEKEPICRAVGGARAGGERVENRGFQNRGTFDENGLRHGEGWPYGNGRGAAYERGLNQGLNEGGVEAGGYYVDPYAGENWNYGYPPPPPQNPSSEQYSIPPQQNYGYPAGPQ